MGCLEDAKGQDNPRLAACVWCASSTNASCIKADECAALEGAGPLQACPVARSPSPSLIENDSVRYGGIAAIAVLLFIIAAIIAYKIYIWRKDKQLWISLTKSKPLASTRTPCTRMPLTRMRILCMMLMLMLVRRSSEPWRAKRAPVSASARTLVSVPTQ